MHEYTVFQHSSIYKKQNKNISKMKIKTYQKQFQLKINDDPYLHISIYYRIISIDFKNNAVFRCHFHIPFLHGHFTFDYKVLNVYINLIQILISLSNRLWFCTKLLIIWFGSFLYVLQVLSSKVGQKMGLDTLIQYRVVLKKFLTS